MSSMSTNSVLVIIAGAILLRAYRVARAAMAVKGVPSLICGFPPLSVVGSVLPSSWWNPGLYFVWDRKDLYKKSEVFSIVPLFSGSSSLYTSSPEVIQQVLGFDSSFEKSEISLGLNLLGDNVVASNGEQWRRHRKVTAPAFNQNTFRNVWRETARIYQDMINADGWNAADTYVTTSFNQSTTKIALLVISACGFGIPLPWADPPVTQNGLSIHETIVMVASSVVIRLLTPRLAYYLPIARLHKVESAYIEFERFMKEHITSQKSEAQKTLMLGDPSIGDEPGDNVFSRLVRASVTEGPYGLDDQELVGNYFVFLFAGHETTAHTLVVTLALLGTHQEEQTRIYNYIQSLLDNGHELSFEDSASLSPVLSCFYEALRLYPAAYVAIRDATKDTVLTYPSVTHPGKDDQVLVRRGTQIALDIIGACRNPRHFTDPDKFMPSRWDQSAESFIGFSHGPRACLGRKFATTEATCLLSHILRDWKVEVVLKEGETYGQWESRVLYPKLAMTLSTGDVPLRFTKRQM